MMKNYGLQGLSLIENDEFLFSLSYHSNDNDIGTAEARREKSLRNSEMIRMNAAPVLISVFFSYSQRGGSKGRSFLKTL